MAGRKVFPGILFILVIISVSGEKIFSQDVRDLFDYLSPVPNSNFHNPETEILIRFGETIDIRSVSDEFLELTGDISGTHKVAFALSRDSLTLIFTPEHNFSSDEKVDVRLREGIRTSSGRLLPAINFWFSTGHHSDTSLSLKTDLEYSADDRTIQEPSEAKSSKSAQLSFNYFNFPEIRSFGEPAAGNIFTTLIAEFSDYLYIFNNQAVPVYARLMPHRITNLIPHQSGKLTYYDTFLKGYIVLDSCMNAEDTLFMKNNYRADSHEILLLENGHVILLAYDTRVVDMSKIVPGGNPYASVTGLVIQELDEDKNLLFQWRSWDHFSITDTYADLLYSVVDYVHGNSLNADTDTTLIISSRNLNEVTKINRLTGQIIWRLGGRNNEFVFQNDTRKFAGQHTAVKTPAGTLTMFDNGVGLDPLYSRGLEYEIDEQNKSVRLMHEYRIDPDIYANVSGNLQRLPDGNTLIYWGPATFNSEQLITEYDSPGNKILEARFDLDIHPNYRAYRSLWKPEIFSFNTDTLLFKGVVGEDQIIHDLWITNNSRKTVTLSSIHHNNLGFNVTGLPLTLEPGSKATVNVSFPLDNVGKVSDNIIFCQETDSLLVTRSLFVSAEIIQSTGTEDHILPRFKVMPNPGKGKFRIKAEAPGEFVVKVTDLAGRVIMNTGEPLYDMYQIDLSANPDGMYLIYLKDLNTGLVRTVKIIKRQ